METTPQAIRAFLARKSLADSRQRAAAASLLKLTETDVLALQHLAWAGALTPSRLGALLRLTSGGTTALVQRLERLGFIAREPHPEDRRSTLLQLSAQGEQRAAELYAPLVSDLDEAAESLSERERAIVAGFLARIAELGESHADELLRAAALERPQVPRVPVPGLWS
ncbi:MAG: MarR family winged helix-turn-helix transcriptional regulator [Solirubrobacteraceae bacterium]